MITTKIEVPPHLCEYIRGKYCNLTSDPVRFPDNLNIYHVIFDLLQKRPSEAPVDRGNLEICLPERSIGKSPVTYNYLGLRSQVIISRKIELMMWAELHQTKWSNEAYADFDVYVEFLSDGTFNIFQKVETPTFVCYSGDFAVNGAQLSGRYRDGEPWGASYAFELSGDGKTLTMISQTDKAEESVYTRTAIPEEVRNAPEVRSALSGALLRIF